jgi:hypothetical protein
MRTQIFRGALVMSVPATEAARRDLPGGAAALAVDALVAALDGREDAGDHRLREALRAERPRLAAIRSRALLIAALSELLGRTDVDPLTCVEPARAAA